MEKERSFYMVLPSNACIDIFPDNKASNFRIRLPQRVKLSGGDWYVGLSQIDYINTVYNVENVFFYYDLNEFGEKFYRNGTLRSGRWSDPFDIAQAINNDIEGSGTDFHDRVQCSYDNISQKFTFRVLEGASIYFPEELATILGFPTEKIISETTTGPYPADLTGGRQSMYVYSNIASPVLVGDVLTPLLRILPLRGGYGEAVSENFQNVHYLPVASSEFEDIEIDISYSNGQQLSFQSGKLIAKLHFVRYKDLSTL